VKHKYVSSKDHLEVLTKFSRCFVHKEFRERFLHEAIKRPVDLHRRICHDIEKVFDGRFKGQSSPIQPSDQCLFLGWFSGITVISWSEAKEIMRSGGGGYLVIKSDGSAFYAETEGEPPMTYAGSH
jgi:hypothetical protein